MDASFTTRFLADTYHITALDGDASIEQMLHLLFPKGTVIEVTVKAKSTGEKRGLCTFKQKYGVCGDVLSADGQCRNDEHNLTPMELEIEGAGA